MLKKLLKKFILTQNITNPADVESKDYILKYSLPFINKFACINVMDKYMPDMHNHNGSFISIILKGGYMEYIRPRGRTTGKPIVKKRTVGSIIYRHHSDFHQVVPFAKTYTLYLYTSLKRRDIDWLVDGKVIPEARHWLKKGYTTEFLREMYDKQGRWNKLT